MDGFSDLAKELSDLNIKVVAASSDPQDKAAETAAKTGLPIGYGVSGEQAELLGAYYQAQRQFIQPTEFVLSPRNKIAQLSYSDGPLARTEASDVIKLVNFLESQKNR